jgi:transposase
MEACASAHHWARELIALGHEVRLMPPAYVKPYVKRGKTDAADAEAIAETYSYSEKQPYSASNGSGSDFVAWERAW